MLFRAGDPCRAIALVLDGEVELVEEVDQRAYRIATRARGTYVGDGAALAGGFWPYAARALMPTRLEMISGDVFLEQQEVKQQPAPVAVAPRAKFLVRLEPASPASARAMPDRGLEIKTFPFVVGRVADAGDGEAAAAQPGLAIDDRRPFRLSRRQFAIVRTEAGVGLSDSGSRLGTFVDGQPIGADPLLLVPGSTVTIAAGGIQSPYRFKLRAE